MLQIKPVKFTALELEIGPLAKLDLQLNDKDLAMSLTALRASDSVVTIQFFLKVDLENDFGMRVVYAVDFSVVDSESPDFVVSDKILEHTFIQVNAPAIGYPFLRALVANVCLSCGHDPVMLPPVNFQAIYDDRKKKSTVSSKHIEVTQ
jgi:preprotein translocase subunit SecB